MPNLGPHDSGKTLVFQLDKGAIGCHEAESLISLRKRSFLPLTLQCFISFFLMQMNKDFLNDGEIIFPGNGYS